MKSNNANFVCYCAVWIRLILQWQCVDLRPFVELMAGTTGRGVVLNEQRVRLHSCIAACVSARRCKLALMRDFVVQIRYNH